MKKRDRLMHQLMINYINITNDRIGKLEDKIDRLEEQNKFLMERENKLQNLEMKNLRCWSYIDKTEKQNKKKKTHEHGEWYDLVTKDGIGVRFGRDLNGRCTVIHEVHRFNK